MSPHAKSYRRQFLETLEQVLAFESKAEFASGVVAAGAAVIESTIAGRSDSEIFLPVNNALSDAGHVAAYLELCQKKAPVGPHHRHA